MNASMTKVGFVATVADTIRVVQDATSTFDSLCESVAQRSEQELDLRVQMSRFELSSSRQKVSEWQKAWVDETVDSEAYFKLLWGCSGHEEVELILGKIRLTALSITAIANEFSTSLEERLESARTDPKNARIDWQKLSGPKPPDQSLSRYDELTQHIEQFVNWTKDLIEQTDLHVRSMHGDQTLGHLDDAVAAREVSVAAYDLCSGQRAVVNLELNLLDNEPDLDKVADVFDWKDLPPTYCIQMIDPKEPTLVRHVELSMLTDESASATNCPVKNDLFERFYSDGEWDCAFCKTQLGEAETIVSHQTVVRKREHTKDRLLPYLAHPTSKHEKRYKKPLSQPQKKLLAFRVAECALFLLGTPWISEISSSTLHDFGEFEMLGKFFLQVEFPRRKWSQASALEKLEQSQIRQIGVLLVETALETVWDSTFANDSSLSGDVLKRLERAMGQPYQQACLSCFNLSDQSCSQLFLDPGEGLSEFYNNVYLRLRDSYNDQRIKNASGRTTRNKKGVIRALRGWRPFSMLQAKS